MPISIVLYELVSGCMLGSSGGKVVLGTLLLALASSGAGPHEETDSRHFGLRLTRQAASFRGATTIERTRSIVGAILFNKRRHPPLASLALQVFQGP